jgi:tetratricopeptide (TPR) repeat protein
MSHLIKICGTENPGRRGDVIFVHGLNGDAIATWQPDGQPNRCWPYWIGEDLPDVGIWSLGYEVNASAWKGPTMPLSDRATNILFSLNTDDLGTSYPVVFITHSLGGLLVKEMLRQSVSTGNVLHTRGIVFLSTPHAGSKLANYLKYLKFLLPSVSLKELQTQEPRLAELNTWYCDNVKSLGIKTQVFCERWKTPLGKNFIGQLTRTLVVDETSSDPGIYGVPAVPMDDDHITISRPERTSTLYKGIKKFVDACLRPSEDGRDLNDTAPLSPQDPNQGILKNVSARAIQTGDITQLINYPAQLSPSVGIPQNLPRSGVVQFVGRQTELDRLHQHLKQNERLAITAVKGMGGIGKTELALQYCYQHHEQGTYSGGVCWLRAQEEDVGAQIVKFATAQLDLKLPEDWDLPTQLDYCWRRWREGDVLIVFDNVNKYQDIESYLPPPDPRFKVMLTTRKELSQSVQSFPIDVLDEPQALELLNSLVRDGRIEQQPDDAKALCEWLGCLPLGLELVGRYLARSPDLSLSEMQNRLEEQSLDSKVLKGLSSAFALSWKELDQQAQQLAGLLSLFASEPIPWELAAACLSNWDSENLEDLRDELIDLSLLKRTGKGVYQLHQLLREFFREKLESLEGADELKRVYCQVLVSVALQIPARPTRKFVEGVLPVIPHLAEAATTLLRWVEDENLFWPFVGLGRFYEGQGAYAQAQPWFEQGLAICRERLGEEHPAMVISRYSLAYLYNSQGQYGKAEPLLVQALEMYKRLLGEEHPDVAQSLNSLAVLYQSQGQYEKAEPLLVQALEIYKRLLGEEHPDMAKSFNNLAELYRDQGKYEQAEPLFVQALEMHKRLFGEEHPAVATSLNNLALLYQSQGKFKDAETLLLQSLEMNKRLLEEHPLVATSFDNLAAIYLSQGKYEQAEPLFVQALEMRKRFLEEEHPLVATSLNNLAALYQSQGKFKDAETLLVQSLEMYKRLFGEEHPAVATSLNNLALLYQSQGKFKDAETLLVQSLEMRKRLLGEEHPNTVAVRQNYKTLLSILPKRSKRKGFKPSQ